ncbi:hypothetical protein [Actinomycetospora flava]|uniref:Uncharacterized protein n=1 Tax=Actinomycetospora flava TaxID=3129232 RepID=A0ABU8MDH2_9PSEU
MSADSAAWRAHVDAATDPRFERAFAILDAVHAERQRSGERCVTRILQLRGELAALLAEVDGRRAGRDTRETP